MTLGLLRLLGLAAEEPQDLPRPRVERNFHGFDNDHGGYASARPAGGRRRPGQRLASRRSGPQRGRINPPLEAAKAGRGFLVGQAFRRQGAGPERRLGPAAISLLATERGPNCSGSGFNDGDPFRHFRAQVT